MTRSTTARRRRLAALTAAGGLLLAAPAFGTSVSASAEPAAPSAVDDCVAPFPVSELAAGDEVDGLTVVSGTTPTGFTGTVLGVLENGIAPDLDMIMVDLDMPEFASSGGVWQGMSGSPVYAEDGRLVGAVSYGLSYGTTKVAGVTPFAAMDDYLGEEPAGRIPVSKTVAQKLAARTGLTARQAGQGFAELPMPTGVAGVSSRVLATARAHADDEGRGYLAKDTYVLGRATTDVAGPETIVAGGNLAVSASFGDVTIAGVGTATSRCGSRVVGFGHPAWRLGSTTLGLHPASAIYVQPDSLGSAFKVANISPLAGTITDDRLAGVTGTFGLVPETTTVTSDVTFGGTNRVGTTQITIPDAAAEATFYQVVGNIDTVLDGLAKGTSVQGWTITGTHEGRPFSLAFTDRYTGRDLYYEPGFLIADLVAQLTSIDGVVLDGIDVDTDVTTSTDEWTVGAVQQFRDGAWRNVTRKAPAQGRPGGNVRLRVKLAGSAGPRNVVLPVISLPRKAAGRAFVSVQGGGSTYSGFYGQTIHELRQQIDGALRHDELKVQIATGDRLEYQEEFYDEGFYRGSATDSSSSEKRPASFGRSVVVGPYAHVIGGSDLLRIKIR